MDMLFKYNDADIRSNNFQNTFYGMIHTRDYGDINLIHHTKIDISDIIYMIDNFIDKDFEKKILDYNFFILGEDIGDQISINEAIVKTQIFNRMKTLDVNYYVDNGNPIKTDYEKIKSIYSNIGLGYNITHHLKGDTNIGIFYHGKYQHNPKRAEEEIVNNGGQEYAGMGYNRRPIEYFINGILNQRIEAFLYEVTNDGYKNYFSHTYIPIHENFHKYSFNNIYNKFFIYRDVQIKDDESDGLLEYGKAKMLISPYQFLSDSEKERLTSELKEFSSPPSSSDLINKEGFFIHVIFRDGETYSGASIPFNIDALSSIKHSLHFLSELENSTEFKKIIPYILVGSESNKCNCLIHNEKGEDGEYAAGPLYCPVCGRHHAKNIRVYDF